MLRTRLRRSLNNATTGVRLTVTHGLGAVPEAWWWVNRNNRGLGSTYLRAVDVPNATHMWLINSLGTHVTIDIFAIAYQARLY